MAQYKWIKVPTSGKKITVKDGVLSIPDTPIIPFIEGDGIGRDIWKASNRILEASVAKAYKNKKKIEWMEVFAGAKALNLTGELAPQETFDAIREFKVAIKGPLETPIGSGFRSLNVTLRQVLDLYACVRPTQYIAGIPSPVKHPEHTNFVIFRENTEDVYAGIEWEQGTPEVKRLIEFLYDSFKVKIRPDSGIGIKPMSIFGSKRLVRKAIEYAIQNNKQRVTLVHKGNIQKYTEGAFRKWGYELAAQEFGKQTLDEKTVWEKHEGKIPAGKVMINDRIADIMFQHVLTRPMEFEVIATPNLNGDYLSDACAAQVGGVGMAPGANIGDEVGLFEATHGTAPVHADKNVANPTALLLSGVLMFEYMGWTEAAKLIRNSLGKTIQQKRVTYDLERQMEGAKKLSTSEFGDAVIENLA
ncbi:isocitrate dehydrogenase (NADP(+)) [Candidatus Acetothermia bacterium]|nr:isocitrate dehydrogenase (NADP(+)) [Candidatus Acetothermia bacterium]MBI3643090.1 isocitrate dehydrogenase (NADP(+)) [Candidatus Acetothermia bacterium]